MVISVIGSSKIFCCLPLTLPDQTYTHAHPRLILADVTLFLYGILPTHDMTYDSYTSTSKLTITLLVMMT